MGQVIDADGLTHRLCLQLARHRFQVSCRSTYSFINISAFFSKLFYLSFFSKLSYFKNSLFQDLPTSRPSYFKVCLSQAAFCLASVTLLSRSNHDNDHGNSTYAADSCRYAVPLLMVFIRRQ